MPSPDRGLLARMDALVALVADRHGLALLPDGRLAAAESRVAARATGLAGRARGRAPVERDAVELLRCVAEGVGLLRVRGDRLEATSLRHAWTQIDESFRAGLTYAAWCQQVTFTAPDSSRFVSVTSTYPQVRRHRLSSRSRTRSASPTRPQHPGPYSSDHDPAALGQRLGRVLGLVPPHNHGIERVRRTPHLAYSFLRRTGLSVS